MPTSYTGQELNVGDGISLSLGTGTLKTNDTFGAAAFVPQVSAAQDAKLQVGNQIITASTNQVSNAISGVTLSLSGTGGPSIVTVARRPGESRKPGKCFRDRLQHRTQRCH